jgi:phage terminase Nu1 subunit (DNA packaging protein)
MIKPELFDVIELLIDLPDLEIKAGELGTIVEEHNGRAYEVEFANDEGETLALLALTPEKFIVVWKNETHSWVSLADRITAMLQTIPEDGQQKVLNFTRSLYKTPA